ncbi:MAG: aspartate kinase [Bacteroidetes bacterium]|jgi:aspartate kinase|nr:aspartate kinase [Bacteroidota bacterium]
MKVFKFGGASVKDASSVKNVATILQKYPGEKLLVVISAMGKTTNALEKVVNDYYYNKGNALQSLEEVHNFHLSIMETLFHNTELSVFKEVAQLFESTSLLLKNKPDGLFAYYYDQIVSLGELVSTKIVSAYLNNSGISNTWLDVRTVIKTDSTYREGNVDWVQSNALAHEHVLPLFTTEKTIVLTQGFIGCDAENHTTTLGREGSDYSAAIFAHLLDAEEMYIWKDVPGVLNADPKFYNDAQKLDQISYNDAIELAYYGASVIHPKTIKPLENKNIPLYVKSFLKPEASGTVVRTGVQTKPLIPSFIFKNNQVLISIAAKDFSFIAEHNLSKIFALFANSGVKINLMQNSAISFSVCVDMDEFKIPPLTEALMQDFKVRYNTGLMLCTIRHYYQNTIDTLTAGKEILLEQRSRNTAQLVIREIIK